MMAHFNWLSELLARYQDEHVLVRRGLSRKLAPAHLLKIDAEDWGRAAQIAAEFGCRWAGVWAEQRGSTLLLNAALAYQGDHLLLRTRVPLEAPQLPSQTPYYPAASRMERHVQDMHGVIFADHPDARRWTRHNRWATDSYPLRHDFAVANTPLPAEPEQDYSFIQTQGAGAYEIPVGPVHAGIIEPGHFRFQAVGETILNLEARLGYVHKGIEKIAAGRDAHGLARLASRVSGDSTVHHAWAACMAMERAARIIPPPRALALRAILAERERIANHLGDIGAICNDVAFIFAWQQFARLRELWLRDNASCLGHRLLMDCIIPGGINADLSYDQVQQLLDAIEPLRRELTSLYAILDDHPSLEDRLATTGFLSAEHAKRLGCLGYVGKASGQDIDLRRNYPYAPYGELEVHSPVLHTGDVEGRMQIRMQEILASLGLLETLLNTLPEGEINTPWQAPAENSEGVGLVEGWRGEILCYVNFAKDGKIARYFPRDPSWFSWPALELLIHDNIVPDFPVCNKSVNGSYSGHDL
ncbi:MAG: NADH-quinone oxidoreductase subunit C [Thiohalomonadaceae bacterium]